MDKMVLDSYTFPENPQEMDLIEAKKVLVTVMTYSGQGVFQWAADIQDLSVCSASNQRPRLANLRDRVAAAENR